MIPRDPPSKEKFLHDKSSPFLTELHRLPEQLLVNQTPTKRERNEVDLIKRMISSYFEVIKKNINDIIPKTIITFLINKVIDSSKLVVYNC